MLLNIQSKIYFLEIKFQKFIDKTFNKLWIQNCFIYINHYMFSSFYVFVIQKFNFKKK